MFPFLYIYASFQQSNLQRPHAEKVSFVFAGEFYNDEHDSVIEKQTYTDGE